MKKKKELLMKLNKAFPRITVIYLEMNEMLFNFTHYTVLFIYMK